MHFLLQHARQLAYSAPYYLNVPNLLLMTKFKLMMQGYYRELWRRSARNIGAECDDWDFGYSHITRDGLSTFVRYESVMLNSHLTFNMMDNKALVYRMLAGKGFAVPRHLRFTMDDLTACTEFFKSVSAAVVVKPANGTGGGRGVTTGITSVASLRKAARLAARFARDLLVEEQLGGHSFRLLFLDGEFIDAIRRDPPQVTGDGRHTIRQLARLESAKRLTANPVTALRPLKIDRDCSNRLKALGLSPQSRLEPGQVIGIKMAVNENCSEQNHSVKSDVHPQTIADLAQLVRDLGVSFAGLDVHCRDISAPLDAGNGLISEINTPPGIHYHYCISDRTRVVPVAELLLDHMFRTGRGVMRLSDAQGDAAMRLRRETAAA